MTPNKIIKDYNFLYYADLIKDGENAKYSTQKFKTKEEGHVYIWVEISDNKNEIVYVGKAGKMIKNRVHQHNAGFRGGSKCGKAHSNRILEGLQNNNSYRVYVRKSPITEVLNESICSCESEELALIKKISPRWNKLK